MLTLQHTGRTAFAAVFLMSALGGEAVAAISVTGSGFNYTQNFDALAASGTPAWTNDSTLTGWHLFTQAAGGTPAPTYATGNGGGNAGSFYSFGTAGSSERALGGLGSGGSYFSSPASGAVAGWIAASFSNDSAQVLSGFTLSFDGEQWRNGGNTSAQPMLFAYGFGATFGSVASWNAPGGSFDWSSPVTGATAAAVDGNAAGQVGSRGGNVSASWNPGETLWVRWTELNDSGNDHGLAIDNISFTAEGAPANVPLPAAVWLLGSGLAVMGAMRRRRGR